VHREWEEESSCYTQFISSAASASGSPRTHINTHTHTHAHTHGVWWWGHVNRITKGRTGGGGVCVCVRGGALRSQDRTTRYHHPVSATSSTELFFSSYLLGNKAPVTLEVIVTEALIAHVGKPINARARLSADVKVIHVL